MKQCLMIIAFMAIYNFSFGQAGDTLTEVIKPRQAKAPLENTSGPGNSSASYKGGDEKWLYYQMTSLILKEAIKEARKQNIPEGKYKLIVEFTVLPGGDITDIKTINDPIGYGMEEAAIKLIQESGKWIPGLSGGKEIATPATTSLTFTIKYK